MHDRERQSHIANLTASLRQLTPDSPMHSAVAASLKLLQREPAVQALLTRLHELREDEAAVSGAVAAELARLIDTVAKDGKADDARLRLVEPLEE